MEVIAARPDEVTNTLILREACFIPGKRGRSRRGPVVSTEARKRRFHVKTILSTSSLFAILNIAQTFDI